MERVASLQHGSHVITISQLIATKIPQKQRLTPIANIW